MNDLSRYSTYQVMLSIDGGPVLIPSPDGRWVEYRDVSDHIQSMQASIDALERLRPHWAQGYSSDSMAAQASTSALSQIWTLLGVTDQTAAMDRLRHLLAAVEQPDDTPTGGEGNSLTITGRLRNARKGPFYSGDPDRLYGDVYGHARFTDGAEIHTSLIVEELGNGLFRTNSGSIYKVETWSAQYVKDQMKGDSGK